MQTFPNDDEIKSYNRVTVYTKDPYYEHVLVGKPLSADAVIAAREVFIVTEQGYYSFAMDNVLSVQFEK